MRLTTGACGKLWLSANGKVRPQSWEGRAACVGCFTGAANAGQPIDLAAEAAAEWREVCPRCCRPTARLIGGEHCVSCYNRAREADIGRNRKGNRPALADQLHDEHLMVLEGRQAAVVTTGRVLDASELMVRAAKVANHPMVFTRPAPAFPSDCDEPVAWDEVIAADELAFTGPAPVFLEGAAL